MRLLAGWTTGSHKANGVTHLTYRKDSGPGVIIIHEVPGMTPKVIAFAEAFGFGRRYSVGSSMRD